MLPHLVYNHVPINSVNVVHIIKHIIITIVNNVYLHIYPIQSLVITHAYIKTKLIIIHHNGYKLQQL